MDDIETVCEDVKSAQVTNDRIVDLMEEKLLDLNYDKSNYLLVGTKSKRKKLQQEIAKKPLRLGVEAMKEVTEMKFLGDYLSSSLGDSVHKTIIKRMGIAKQSAYEIRTIVEDRRADRIGSMNLAFEIWNASVCSMLFYNAETWTNINKKSIKILNSVFLHFFCLIFLLE